MSLDLNGLSQYTDQNSTDLVRKAFLGARIFDYATVMSGIKYKEAIQLFETDAVLQAGGCGWNASGTTKLTQQDMEVAEFKVNEGICPDDLNKYWGQKLLNAGSYNENLPFEAVYAEEKAAKVAAEVERQLINGEVGAGDLIDGLITQMDGVYSAIVIDANTAAVAAITAANIIEVVENAIASISDDLLDQDVTMYVGFDLYKLYNRALRAANLFNNERFGDDNAPLYVQDIYGTNVKMVALKPLNSSNKFFITIEDNLRIGTDLVNDWEEFKIFYFEAEDEVRVRMKGKFGTTFVYPELVSYFKLA